MGLTYRFGHGGTPPLNIVELVGGGAGFGDFDGDGWADVVLCSQAGVALYRNQQGKTFTDATQASGLGGLKGRWYGMATGDYDNDGLLDLFLTGYNVSALLRNVTPPGQEPRFQDVSATMAARPGGWCTSAAFADVNRDGFLDLYVARYVRFEAGMPEFREIRGVPLSLGPDGYDAQKGVLYLNEGGKRFRDITVASGLDTVHGKGLGVAFADAEGDGDDDLYVANDQQSQDFMLNESPPGKRGGIPRFRNTADENGTALSSEGDRQGGMGVDWGDYNDDGRLDLFVANFADEPKSLYRAVEAGLYEHAGIPAGVGVTTRPWVAFGSKWADLDNDGRLELAIVNGHVQDWIQKTDPANPYPQLAQLFLNTGNGRFREVSGLVGPDFQKPMVGRALAVADYDHDGDLDLLAADLEGTARLFRNDPVGTPPGGSPHWLRVRVLDATGKRDALGARVELTVNGVRQLREVRTDGSYLAAQDARVHFGLGSAATVESLRVRWPGGAERTLQSLPVDQETVVRPTP